MDVRIVLVGSRGHYDWKHDWISDWRDDGWINRKRPSRTEIEKE
jgi:hypothetical protein